MSRRETLGPRPQSSQNISVGEDLITLTQNWDNKLRTVKSGATTIIALKYDPDGSRIRKDSSTTVRKYIVDIVADLPVILMELDGDEIIKKTYIYENSRIIAQQNGDQSADKYFYVNDRLGSVRQVIDGAGDVVRNYTYSPFGQLLESGAAQNIIDAQDFFKWTANVIYNAWAEENEK